MTDSSLPRWYENLLLRLENMIATSEQSLLDRVRKMRAPSVDYVEPFWTLARYRTCLALIDSFADRATDSALRDCCRRIDRVYEARRFLQEFSTHTASPADAAIARAAYDATYSRLDWVIDNLLIARYRSIPSDFSARAALEAENNARLDIARTIITHLEGEFAS